MDKNRKTEAVLSELRPDELTRRRMALLTAIIRIFRETSECETEEEVAQICLKVAEELTGSKIGFIGELNPEGLFDTTTLSQAGWDACKVSRPEAYTMLKNMPNRARCCRKTCRPSATHLVYGGAVTIRGGNHRHDRPGQQGVRVHQG